MKKILAAFLLVLVIFTSLGAGVARSQRPENPGRSNLNPSEDRSQRPDQDGEESQRGKSGIAHIKSKNNKLQVNYEDDGLEDATSEGEIEEEEEFEVDGGRNSFKVRAHENASLVIRNKLAAQTNFPLKVNLETNELIVTTPKGEKTVTVLPDQAVFNMLAANVLDQLGGKGGLQWLADQVTPTSTPSGSLTPTSTPSATITDFPSPTSTPSGEVTETPETSPAEFEAEEFEGESPIRLILDDGGNLIYEIDGVKVQRFLGLFKVDVNRIVIVSAETGELIEVKQNLANRILDLLSVD